MKECGQTICPRGPYRFAASYGGSVEKSKLHLRRVAFKHQRCLKLQSEILHEKQSILQIAYAAVSEGRRSDGSLLSSWRLTASLRLYFVKLAQVGKIVGNSSRKEGDQYTQKMTSILKNPAANWLCLPNVAAPQEVCYNISTFLRNNVILKDKAESFLCIIVSHTIMGTHIRRRKTSVFCILLYI